MRVETRLFGEIDIAEEKIITLGRGLIGYPDMKRFTLIFDEEKQGKIMWLQSLDEPQFAIPVVDPAGICADYNPTVNDELLTPLGQFSEESSVCAGDDPCAIGHYPNDLDQSQRTDHHQHR